MTSSHHATISMVTRSTQYINQQITHTHTEHDVSNLLVVQQLVVQKEVDWLGQG